MKTALVTGAAGFTGYSLTKRLSENGYKVYAVVRPLSEHNDRLTGLKNVKIITLDVDEIEQLVNEIQESIDYCFHLIWIGQRYDFETQLLNVRITLRLVETISKLQCRRFICTGSQAEYGETSDCQEETMAPHPFCPYGASKVAACYLSKSKAEDLGMEWVWARIFSLYGTFEPSSRLLPMLIQKMICDENVTLSSGRQKWDYLHVEDAADALIALAEKGKAGEIYDICSGDSRCLKDFIVQSKIILGSNSDLSFGDDPKPFVSLQPIGGKIKKDTGWEPRIGFEAGIIRTRDELKM